MDQASRRPPASASACRAPAKNRAARCSSTGNMSPRCAATTTSLQRSFSVWSMTTSSATTSDADRLLAEALHRVWGFSDFRPLQREAMHAILDARDSVVVLPTGGGKSLCFQAPALVLHLREKDGIALVISPLISLMKDQVDGLRVDGVAASYLNSTLQPHERDEVLASVREHRCRLLYVSPAIRSGET